MSTSSGHPTESDSIAFVGVVSKHPITVVLFFLHLEIKSTGNGDWFLEYISPFVNTRSVATGRVSDNVKFEPERLQNSLICAALCLNVDSTGTSDAIPGCNIFSGQEDPSVLFDFGVAHSDLFNFYLICAMRHLAVDSYFKSSTSDENIGYLRSYEFEFGNMMKKSYLVKKRIVDLMYCSKSFVWDIIISKVFRIFRILLLQLMHL